MRALHRRRGCAHNCAEECLREAIGGPIAHMKLIAVGRIDQFLDRDTAFDTPAPHQGEAAKHVPATLTRTYPEIEWKSIAGMRDKLVHDYFGVNLDILWDVLTTKLPVLLKQVDGFIEETG